MTLDSRIEALCKGLSYKDWTFIYGPYDGTIKIGPLGYTVPDSYGGRVRPGGQLFYEFIPVDATMTDEAIKWDIAAHVLALIEHDAFEWFQFKGEPVINPHEVSSIFYDARRRYYRDFLDAVRMMNRKYHRA